MNHRTADKKQIKNNISGQQKPHTMKQQQKETHHVIPPFTKRESVVQNTAKHQKEQAQELLKQITKHAQKKTNYKKNTQKNDAEKASMGTIHFDNGDTKQKKWFSSFFTSKKETKKFKETTSLTEKKPVFLYNKKKTQEQISTGALHKTNPLLQKERVKNVKTQKDFNAQKAQTFQTKQPITRKTSVMHDQNVMKRNDGGVHQNDTGKKQIQKEMQKTAKVSKKHVKSQQLVKKNKKNVPRVINKSTPANLFAQFFAPKETKKIPPRSEWKRKEPKKPIPPQKVNYQKDIVYEKTHSHYLKEHKENVVLQWRGPEFEHYPKDKMWYTGALAILAVIILYAVFKGGIIMAIVFFLIGLVGYLVLTRPQKVIDFAIMYDGILIGDELFSYDDMVSFWIFYEPPHTRVISFHLKGTFRPYLHVPLHQVDPVDVHKALVEFIPEVKQKESLIDICERLLRM